eukprot:GHVR01081450.1.p1 GENE.GHVR01081450.1~~GHVR01081450.1.p1  ORF type:complete len:141 (+),score=11.74 GHVR01081450.1:24-446(+)
MSFPNPVEMKVVRAILKDVGINQYDDDVEALLVELIQRDTWEVANRACDYARLAGRNYVDGVDTRHAVSDQLRNCYDSRSDKNDEELIKRINSQEIPKIPEEPGLVFAPEAEWMTFPDSRDSAMLLQRNDADFQERTLNL